MYLLFQKNVGTLAYYLRSFNSAVDDEALVYFNLRLVKYSFIEIGIRKKM